MASASGTFSPNTSFDPEAGTLVELVEGIARITAPNRGPYTFTGTNTFLVGVDSLVVIDPGPNDSRHLRALLEAIDGRPVEAILLTHTHRDHAGLARRLRKKTGAPIWSNGPTASSSARSCVHPQGRMARSPPRNRRDLSQPCSGRRSAAR